MIKKKVVNVVATAALDQEIELYKLSQFPEILYNLNTYGGRVAYLKTKSMDGKVSIFSSGKMISIGTKSEQKALNELQHATNYLVTTGLIYDVPLIPIVRNVVFSVDFGRTISLEELSLNQKAFYEPEQFSGAILKFYKPFKATILVFASGKAVIAGLTKTNQINVIIERMKEMLEFEI